MTRLDFLEKVTKVFKFATFYDSDGNEYVLLETDDWFGGIGEVEDKTEFEATYNHTHIYDNIPGEKLEQAISVGKILGKVVFDLLVARYPDKKFYVFLSVSKNTMIIRFHQRWDNEAPYYQPGEFDGTDEMLICWNNA